MDRESGEDMGSVWADSRDCAEFAAKMEGGDLGECQGKDGVDITHVCSAGCDW